MISAYSIATLLYFVLLAAYFWSFRQLYDIIDDEHPEWLSYKGEPSIFFRSMPRMFDPNVSLRVMRVAFTRRANLLASPAAGRHVIAVRALFVCCLILLGLATYASSISR